MLRTIDIQIAGLGLILYSPWATRHITPSSDYLTHHFWSPEDVASHVNAYSITCVCTGSPGDFHLHFYTGRLNDAAVQSASFRARLGVLVRDSTLCVRDLYDLLEWDPVTLSSQALSLDDGYYRITAYTSRPPSGVLGDYQDVYFHLQRLEVPPDIYHDGVPQLC
ncbi:MAG: hypothetical protein IT186_08705 [Acidobacteria bacterium]|nr:hypothetical protein [Acidobacteriota bacterium]